MLDRDPFLTELFAQQAETLPADDFLSRLRMRMEREQRRRRINMIFRIAVALSIATLIVVLAPQLSAKWLSFTAMNSRALEELAVSPIAWLGFLALALSLAPTLLMWQGNRMNRLGSRIREQIGWALGK